MPQFYEVNGRYVDAETMRQMREKEAKKQAKEAEIEEVKEVKETPKKGGRKTSKK